MNIDLLIPDISKMLQLLQDHPYHFLSNWWATFFVSTVASISALFLSVILSVLALRFKKFDYLMTPIVAVSQSFPLQSIAPIIIIVMGIGFHTKTTIAFVIAFFPIYSICTSALKSTPKKFLSSLAISNASFLNGVKYIRLPIALPAIVSAAKVGFTLAVLGTVVAEFIQPDKGLGYLLIVSQSNYNIEVMYLCVLFLIIQGTTIYVIFTIMEKKLIKDRRLA